MPKLIEMLIPGIAAFLIAVFLPKHLITLIRELIKFIVTSLLKFWYLTLLIIFLIFFINIITEYKYLGEFTSYRFILSILLSLSIIIPLIALKRELFKKYQQINIALFGCFSVKENEYLTIDIDSQNLNEKINKVTEKVASDFYTYHNSLIKLNNIIIPKFIPILLGHNGLNKFIRKRVTTKKHLTTLHFIRNINEQNVSVILNIDKDSLTDSAPVTNAEKLINSLSDANDLNSSKTIELTMKIYLLVFGQSFNDLMINKNNFNVVHYILDDTERLIKDIRKDISNLSETHKNAIEAFLIYWTSYVERYKAVLLLEQKQFIGAIQHIIKSTKLNPYFPYDNYSTLKLDYTKKYGIALASEINETNKILKTNIDELANEKVMLELAKQVQFAETSFNYQIIKRIIQNDNSKEIEDIIKTEIDKLDNTNPFILLTKSEVTKHLKKGTEKINEIYVDRFDECVSILKEILKIDGDFPLINTKLGLMLLMKGWHFNNEQLIKKGTEEYKKGMHFMIELGLNINEKSPTDNKL